MERPKRSKGMWDRGSADIEIVRQAGVVLISLGARLPLRGQARILERTTVVRDADADC